MRKIAGLLAVLMAQTIWGHAESVKMLRPDGPGLSSFDSQVNWSVEQAPDAAHDYVVEGNPDFFLRTPVSPGNQIFAGKSLTLSGATLLLKANKDASYTFDGDGLILDGGAVRSALNPFGSVATIAGLMKVTPKGGAVMLNDGCIDLAAATTLEGTLTFQNRIWVYPKISGPVTFGPKGKLVAGPSITLVQTLKSVYSFDVAARDGAYIEGEGSNAFKGSFVFNLGPEDLVPGNSWKIVDTPKKDYLDTFSVTNFVKGTGEWISADGNYLFDEKTGVLSVVDKTVPRSPAAAKEVLVEPKPQVPAEAKVVAEAKIVAPPQAIANPPESGGFAYGWVVLIIVALLVVGVLVVLLVMLFRSFKG